MSFSLETLEFEKLLDLIGRHAQTPMGLALVERVRPHTNKTELEREIAMVTEAILLNEKQVTWSFSGLSDPSDAIAILKVRNATLEPHRLIDLTQICNQALFVKSSINPEKILVPRLWQLVEGLPPALLAAIEGITKKLLPSGELEDSASPELARLRREISNQRARLTKSLEAVLRDSGDAVQDEIVTVRNERFVIPIKADFRGKVAGVAHGFSSSGATVFIEPLAAIEANNELQNLRGKEEREVARIMFDLTEDLREQLPAVELAVNSVAELDLVKSKLEFARKFGGIVPEITDDETLQFVDARHPLLEENLRGQASVVPSSFELSKKTPLMIISGANAGGKTVVLKTAGLLSLMAISGLPVPARKARIPFYRSVMADIGDHQSLLANLSTFSSHMSNIADMLQNCYAPALVLLDEAGTGTDPEEGSALGVAIVDHFRRECGAQVIASTHYRGLKIYAANDENVVNASVEFNEKTLQPTYRLLLGLAGASSGIEIARRFGISADVIEKARQNLDISAQVAENYLRKLQTESTSAEDLRIALEEEREAVAMKYASLEVEAGKLEKERRRQFEDELARVMDEFDRQSRAFIQTLEDKILKNKLEKERVARKAELNRAMTSKIQSSKVKTIGQASGTQSPVGRAIGTIDVGSRVITTFGNIGTVERIDKEVAEVLVGGMRLREKIANLQVAASEHPTSGSRAEKLQKQTKESSLRLDSADAESELNLIGKTTAEAEYEIDRFLDEAYLASYSRVRIIHGFGTGALKNFVHHYLKGHPHVEQFAFAPQNQGGNGATIADLKQ
ncbi:MAG: endonuclease MutS2 [Pyrinomonadaceae bacterium]